ncbi:MAG: hypothetical protein ACE141_04045 [Bryobacteraceae bacterium]
MPKRSLRLLFALLCACWPALPVEVPATCGTHAETATEKLFVHRQALRTRPKLTGRAQAERAARARDVGEIAVLEDSGDIVVGGIAFNLDQTTLAFVPVTQDAARYRFETGAASYDAAVAAGGTVLTGLGDDDSRKIELPFPFPFYGHSYRELFVNSDGNLTFGAPDNATSSRSLGRMVAGAPRVAPLFRDLDPSHATVGVKVFSEPGRLVVSWVGVPEYSSFGSGRVCTFQVRLFAEGRIEFAYGGVGSSEAVVGISPGGRLGTTSAVSFRDGVSEEYAGTLAQRFADRQEVDIYSAALKFYETHEDAYDYLVFFNTMEVQAAPGALAYEVTVRDPYGTGYGDENKDIGAEFGSPRRLQSVMNMGPLSQYPTNPDTRVPGRGLLTGDTTMTLLGHEAGHLFLAFASVRDPLDPLKKVMLQSDGAHWSFNFNSEASLLEGNRLQDMGDGTFRVAGTVEGYSPLDQYLMGLTPASEVPPTFVVVNSTWPSDSPPRIFAPPFSGTRRDIHVEELARTEGRRTPDVTVSQRHFRFAFILIVPQGTTPSDVEISKLERYRSRFPADFNRWTGGRASAETTLRRSLNLSVAPAGGLVTGRTGVATVSIEKPAAEPLAVSLERPAGAGYAIAQNSVTIPVGATSASFPIAGVAAGVYALTARVSDPQFETVRAAIKILPSPSDLRITLVSSRDPADGPATYRVTDLSGVAYAGVSVSALASSGGSVSPQLATSDDAGLVRFTWTPGVGEQPQLTLAAQGAEGFVYEGVVNAASYAPGLAPGGFASIFGYRMAGGGADFGLPPYPKGLAGVEVSLGGRKAVVQYASDRQVNLVVPSELGAGTVSLTVSAPAGTTLVTRTTLGVAPGIFFDTSTGYGAILRNQNFLEIYCTGLGAGLPVAVNLGGQKQNAVWSGPVAAYPGLYQVNVEIPAGLSGEQTISIETGGRTSNVVKVRL